MIATRYKAAIFDLDGTLVHSEPAWEAAKRQVLDRLGVRVPQSTYDAFVGRGVRGFLTEVLGSNLTDQHRTELANEIGAAADILLPLMRQPIPGAAQSISRLADAGLRIAICSSSPRRHILAALAQLGLADRISAIVSGAELPRGKPDPLPYRETLRLLDLGPAEAFAVEDALPGAMSAHAAGLTVIGIGPQSAKPGFLEYCNLRASDYSGFDRTMFASP
ncbi:HAD family phosphatase [Frigidibacter sp. RF13]|uniref:HAD family hydrolase n=1 Tax=Frigidibacter sp. RF13 TaxID=2997340 RepID=UPI0022703609|nr:HAD family phosphatase [Frigidibacter sp. RF13]MCY1128342.1 HAD family phosphatase [Frigidibacter sp. RF13]